MSSLRCNFSLVHLLGCHDDCWGLWVAIDLIPSMKSSLPVALAHEAKNKKSGVGPVGLHWSDSSPAELTQRGQTCALHWFPLQGYDVKCPLPWSNCLVPEMIQQKKYVSCCILHGGCLTLLQHPGSGVWVSSQCDGLNSSNTWVFKKTFLLPYLLMQEGRPLGPSGFAQFLAAQMLMAHCVRMSDCAQHRCFCSIALSFPRQPGHL